MTTLPPSEVTPRFTDILSRLHRGEEIVVAENGLPLAKIVLAESDARNETSRSIEQANAAILRHVVKSGAPGGLDNKSIDRDLAHEFAK